MIETRWLSISKKDFHRLFVEGLMGRRTRAGGFTVCLGLHTVDRLIKGALLVVLPLGMCQ
jgi:hypothetical protein